jgi:hypothetical protein
MGNPSSMLAHDFRARVPMRLLLFVILQIYLAAMGDAYYEHDELGFLELEDDPVIAPA